MGRASLAAAFLLVSCAAHLTHARSGFEGCSASGVALVCHGKPMLEAQCGSPSGDECGSLSVVYAGGERVVLAEHGARRPEMASDGSRIWFRDPALRTDLWNVFDPRSGVMQQLDPYEVEVLRGNGAVPLWPGGAR